LKHNYHVMQQQDIKNKNTILECAKTNDNSCLISSNIWLILFRKYVSLVSNPSRKMFDSLLVNTSFVYVFHPFVYIYIYIYYLVALGFCYLFPLFSTHPFPSSTSHCFGAICCLYIYLGSVYGLFIPSYYYYYYYYSDD
jgi:hypothetical protein